MGLIKKIFGGIFALLGGILKIFGIGKSDYYIQVDPSTSAPPTPVEATPAPAAPAPPVATATPTVVAPATPAPAPAAPAPMPVSKPAPVLTETFAPKFLMPSVSAPRRRPGPSLSSFMDMARKVKPSA